MRSVADPISNVGDPWEKVYSGDAEAGGEHWHPQQWEGAIASNAIRK